MLGSAELADQQREQECDLMMSFKVMGVDMHFCWRKTGRPPSAR